MIIAFLTGHDAEAPRRVDFHFWADVLEKRGHEVKFVTVGCSALTPLKRPPRLFRKPYNKWIRISRGVEKFLWWPAFHPISLGSAALDRLTAPIFALYPRMLPERFFSGLGEPDIFIVENGAGLMLVPRLAQRFPKARFIYTVSDRMETLGMHPLLLRSEQRALRHFDKIRLPAIIMEDDFPEGLPIEYIPPGLDKAVFDAPCANPYTGPKNAISVGDMLFDGAAIAAMARSHPDWSIHIFGRKARLGERFDNVIEYGERPFQEIVPYLKHADIGLATYGIAPSADYLSQSSLKMVIYTYCALPIVAPDFAAPGRPHVCAYDPADLSNPPDAFARAIIYDRGSIDPLTVLSWDDVVDRMLTFQD